MECSGDLPDGEHTIGPVMFGDAAEVAGKMLESGIFVTAFSFPSRSSLSYIVCLGKPRRPSFTGVNDGLLGEST
ncbi:hypothetical protein ACFY5D_17815 [Paeniglutamicibacter sp. NPDC012692]|uniref:hypothetical protein n=1 Tax=Paeniglutamicibacter sp. NPDC012692 TaxID=3364388 RepID=UPI0036C8C086